MVSLRKERQKMSCFELSAPGRRSYQVRVITVVISAIKRVIPAGGLEESCPLDTPKVAVYQEYTIA